MKIITTMSGRHTSARTLLWAGLLVAAVMTSAPALAGHKHKTTIIRETVYHTPSYHAPYHHNSSVIIPVTNSLYLGLGGIYLDSGHRHDRIHRTVSRHDRYGDRHHDRYQDNYYDRGFRHPGHGNGFGYRDHDRRHHEPVRGRWSGAERKREIIYIERDGRRGSSYREAERRSVVIRERSR